LFSFGVLCVFCTTHLFCLLWRSGAHMPTPKSKFYGSAAISDDSLIGRMTLEAETDRAAHPYGIATFVDEQGLITHVNISKDPIAAIDRIEKRLGLTPQPAPARQARGVSR